MFYTSNKTIILVGKSCTGKSCIERELKDRYGLTNVISYTTRPKRENEINGVDYHFVTEQKFKEMIDRQEFLEYRTYETNYNKIKETWYYGITKEAFEKTPNKVCVVDLQGLNNISKYAKRENVFVIGVYLDDYLRLRRAIQRPNFDLTEWDRRYYDDNIKFADNKFRPMCDIIIDNDETLEGTMYVVDKILKENGVV